MSGPVTEQEALAHLQRVKASYQSFIKINYEHAAEDCRTCPTQGVCCTDAHFVNVHITRLEAVAIRETLERTPRLTEALRRTVYSRAREAVERYNLRASGDTFAQTYSCPLFEPQVGCLVHRRAKPAPCIQHACYENWEDLPPASLQSRSEHRIEQLNQEIYGAAWAWLPIPLWLCLIDPQSDGAELVHLAREWSARPRQRSSNSAHQARQLVDATRRRFHRIRAGSSQLS
jgi:hypothetical protein